MNRPRRYRYRTGALAVMVGLLAAVGAMAGLALAKDGNRDRLPDRWEKRHHLSLKVKQTNRDQDRDSLRNRAEFLVGDNPRDSDSDDDGVMDGDENAGTIQSFDAKTGRLTIALFGGDTVSGLVTGQTRIECEDEHSSDVTDFKGKPEPGDDHGGGDNSGPGSSNSGPGNSEDNGVQNDNDGPNGDNDNDANCTTSNLIPGAIVEEADLEIENGTATFDEVELAD